MVSREITKKSYRETAKTISEDTDSRISHTAVRNIVIELGKKIKEIEEEKIKELESRIPEPKVVKKQKGNKIIYVGKYEIANNFTGRAKQYVLDLLKDKKCSELMLIT